MMQKYSLLAPAKINLYLEVVGNRSDGYHELIMILQSIELADRIDIQSTGRPNIQLHCNAVQLGEPSQNLAYKAAQLMCDRFPDQFNHKGGVEITLDKQIPIAAGLAGGSTDAAAVLVGINLLWELGLTQPELQELAAQLGSDVPFCIAGGTAIATGRGECLDPLPSPHGVWVVLGKYQDLEVSTPWAYQTYQKQFSHTYVTDAALIQSRTSHVQSGELVQSIMQHNSIAIAQHLYNDLEKVVLPHHPQVEILRKTFEKSGVMGTMMSGSGPTVFALCETAEQAQKVKEQVSITLNDSNLGLWITQFSTHGISIRPH